MDIPIKSFSMNCYQNKTFLKGLIYEWYSYNHLLNKYKSIKFVRTKHDIVDKNHYNYFKYNSTGNIVYNIGNTTFSEFDVIGIKNKEIYLFEISRSKSKYLHNKIIRRRNLMKIIFPNYKINVCFIIPKDLECYKKYDKIILPEPNYEEIFNSGQFIFTDRIYNCISLKDFVKYTNNNSLINEIIYSSTKYYETKKFQKHNDYQDLITKLFDINDINRDEIKCYDLIDKKNKSIRYIKNRYYINSLELNNLDVDIINEIKYVTGRSNST